MFLTDETPARALNIEQAKELSAYRIASENENRSPPQHGSTCQDDWQIDTNLFESPGEGGDVMSQVDDGLAVANEDDRYATVEHVFTSVFIQLTCHFFTSTLDLDSDGNKRARSPSLEILGMHVRQAKKVKNRKGRSCANDFESSDEVLINKACIIYRCLISTENAFPSHILEVEFAQRAWKDACQLLDVNVQPHPDALKIVSLHPSSRLLLTVPIDYEARFSDAWRGQDQDMPPHPH